MSSKLRDKFMQWKSQSWPFHVRLKVVQCIMEPIDKESFAFCFTTSSYLLWKKRDNMGITWVPWNHLATPKRLGKVGILNLSKHMMMAPRFSSIQDMCSNSQPLISIVRYFIENKGLTHGRTTIKASWWQY